ncbi:hypothetical protein GCM10009584_04500 [Ornithinimicrobium humiphilum]|uniref:Camelysin-like metallo-endopeptidase n=1 Tax=Ornithinimicrobium humiphilum TaxID=125288 RepID=A0A543K7W4_9MICO|nr:TasA family protein [Ornithinimicrobium humiphilum]TQM91178.1 camelysin-like metallo-endopeptidase [Ornithinimicrobium humiphilum]
MNRSSRSAKVLAPLAVLLAAGALAVGSGATFTSTSSNSLSSVASGSLVLTNSKDAKAVFDVTNIKPGDTVTGSLTLSNTGTLPATFSLTEASSTNTFSASKLTLKITDSKGGVVYNDEFGGLEDDAKKGLGVFQPGDAETYTFVVGLDTTAGNTDQLKAASATFVWDAVQLAGESR